MFRGTCVVIPNFILKNLNFRHDEIEIYPCSFNVVARF